ncbi:hypothetical protein PR048_017304 [Dryococelus australis]|uniref:Uncharacterized protein n=1 Tax=Dryococelus australis TaxID=614101 RepID=A0ABQ9H957_9NEOP|nr:hypothetical protein PR048_017304 [Dryococelus australis]
MKSYPVGARCRLGGVSVAVAVELMTLDVLGVLWADHPDQHSRDALLALSGAQCPTQWTLPSRPAIHKHERYDEHQNARAGETGVPLENPPVSDTVRHDSHNLKIQD